MSAKGWDIEKAPKVTVHYHKLPRIWWWTHEGTLATCRECDIRYVLVVVLNRFGRDFKSWQFKDKVS